MPTASGRRAKPRPSTPLTIKHVMQEAVQFTEALLFYTKKGCLSLLIQEDVLNKRSRVIAEGSLVHCSQLHSTGPTVLCWEEEDQGDTEVQECPRETGICPTQSF